jgi:hypothetical protein
MKRVYHITLVSLSLILYYSLHAMEQNQEKQPALPPDPAQKLYKQMQEAVRTTNPTKLTYLLKEYQASNNNNSLFKEEYISTEEMERASTISVKDLQNMSLRNRSSKTISQEDDDDSKLSELLKLAYAVVEERKKEAQLSIWDISSWPKKTKWLLGVGVTCMVASLMKLGLDIGSYFDESNKGFNLGAQIVGDGLLFVTSIPFIYEGLTNEPAQISKAKAHESQILLQSAILEGEKIELSIN